MTQAVNHGHGVVKNFEQLPKMHTTYANIIKSLVPKKDKVQKQKLPTAIYEIKQLIIDQANLKDYRKICGFDNDGRVPVTYFAVLSQTLQMNMMAKEDFPFAMLGLIHIHNTTTQYRPIYDSETVKMRVRLDNLQDHDKGQMFDFVTDVYVADTLVWSGVSTYLSRQKTNKPKSKETPTQKLASVKGGLNLSIKVPEDIGRQYAFVSGDFNLIHLHPLSAKAFGYPKAIAHGMWSKAKIIAQFKQLPDKYSVSVDFKLPVFLPSSTQFIAVPTDDSDWRFGLYDKTGEKPHLLGAINAV